MSGCQRGGLCRIKYHVQQRTKRMWRVQLGEADGEKYDNQRKIDYAYLSWRFPEY